MLIRQEAVHIALEVARCGCISDSGEGAVARWRLVDCVVTILASEPFLILFFLLLLLATNKTEDYYNQSHNTIQHHV